MDHEKRRHERKNINKENVPGEFRLEIDGESFSLNDPHDVSISGMGVGFSYPVEVDTPIKVGFQAEDLELYVRGKVAWCRESKPNEIQGGAFRIGIEFDNERADHNCLLFMALRSSLDTFD